MPKTDQVTLAISNYIADNGIPVSFIAKRTKIPDHILYSSMRPAKEALRRPLRADEVLAIMQLLKIDFNALSLPSSSTLNPMGGDTCD